MESQDGGAAIFDNDGFHEKQEQGERCLRFGGTEKLLEISLCTPNKKKVSSSGINNLALTSENDCDQEVPSICNSFLTFHISLPK